ncbi:zinc ribbon domain-containing protein [Aromatoleum anaerobium]|uniref:zinc ribbon domain-containing protein n=1 Tax=Aromatoleum anaerobium TaxID=182180 RepID=UPI001B7CDA11|nr:zinc ribbon domain-containing protein [Aromatoleum anaerobium]MCK0506529.1 transposase [Aromatoleum anaerobium]
MVARLTKSISDANWSEFVRQLEYKAQWYGRTLIGVDRWYPSSKRCSDCRHAVSKLPLSVREWVCPATSTANVLRERPHGRAAEHRANPSRMGGVPQTAHGYIESMFSRPNDEADPWKEERP